MHILSHIGLFNFITQLSMAGMAAVLVGNLWLFAPSMCLAAGQGKTAAVVEDDEDSGDWVFDKSTYTNDPKTGKRVDQYKHEKTPYRDPNAWFDSPMISSAFFNDSWSGGFYDYYNPFYYFGVLPEEYSKYYFGQDGSGYYPYDGDPNYEENEEVQDNMTDKSPAQKSERRTNPY